MSSENYFQEELTKSQVPEEGKTEDKEGKAEDKEEKTEEGNWHMLLEGIDETKKILLNKICDNNPNLKEGFYNFLKYTKKKSLIRNANEDLKKCETEEDVRKFVENHQGVKVGIMMDEHINKTRTEEVTAEAAEGTAVQENAAAEVAEETEAKKKEIAKVAEDNEKQNKENSKNLQETAEKIRTYKIAEEKHKILLSRYPELGEKTDKNSDLYKNVERELKNKGVIKQLEEVGKDINDSNFVEKYISYQATLQELSSNRANYDKNDISLFERAVKNLNNACNIPDTRLSSFSKENIGQTRTELFAEGIGNESLRNARKNNLSLPSHEKAYEKMFPEEMGEDAIFVKYGQFLEGDLKKYWEQYKDNYKGFMDNLYNIREQKSQGKELTPEEENILKIPGLLKGIKEKFDGSAKNMIEEMCLITQINAMAKCIGQESFGLNKANDIKYDETGAMVLDGHIDGVNFSVRHNFNEARAPLQTSSKLIESVDGNTLEFGVNGKQKFKDSPFKLPSQESIFGMVSDFVASTNFSGERFNSVEDYIDNMQEGIVGKMDDIFDKDAEVANDYMQNEIKGEKIVDGSLGLIKHIKPSIDFTKVINRNDGTERKMFDFMKILNYNIENSTPEEKNKLDWSINEIRKITDNYKSNEKSSGLYSESVSKYLENDKWLDTSPEKEGIDTKQDETSTVDENENLEKQDQRLGLIFDMFIDFNKNPTDKSREGNEGNYGTPLHMIVNDLYIQLHDKPKETKKQLERNEISDREQKTADNVLNLEDLSLRPPESTVSMA